MLFMTNEEIWNIGLEERTDELSKLQSEYDRLDVECRKAEFEKDMYARLRDVNNAMLYKQKFSEKYEKCARTSEKLTKQKNALENEISVLKKEIYYIAIIRKEYADGSVDYETSFTDIEDFNESYYCILKCIGKEVGIATDNPKVLTYACVIRGKEEIEKELLHGNGKQLEYI